MGRFVFPSLLASVAAASVLTPPVLPLLVRNPYLSAWLPNAREPPWESWPMFWNGNDLGFAVMASLPGTDSVYPLLGRPQDFLSESSTYSVSMPTYHGSSYDASTTNFTYSFGASAASHESVKMTLSFLSPVTPTSTFRQSLPAAYLAFYVEGPHDVNVYVDVNGQWVSRSTENRITWNFNAPAPTTSAQVRTKSWTVSRESEELYTENDDRAEWGSFWFTGPADACHESGPSADLRHQFAKHGHLRNEVDDRFRKIREEEPAFAFSKLIRRAGAGDGATGAAVFTFAFTQDPVVQFAAARGLTHMRPLWASYISTTKQMIDFHYADFHTAFHLAQESSTKLSYDALSSGSREVLDILALSARQIMGGCMFAGTPSNPILFMKEISSSGNLQTVDVIFPSFPFFLYVNPAWLKYLLDPLLEHQASGLYPHDYSMHDVGTHYPNGTGHPDGNDEYMPVEECGDMLIMGLALIHAMQDGQYNTAVSRSRAVDEGFEDDISDFTRGGIARTWAARYYGIWKQWTGYLVRESLIPKNQLSTDDFAGTLANQTNLALKGIIGIKAMAEIAEVVGEQEDARRYNQIADDYVGEWQKFGISRDESHAKLSYTWFGSWTTLYNLYADALLCFHMPSSAARGSVDGQETFTDPEQKHFVPRKIYSMQSRWYRAVLQRYGVPLDSRHLYAKSDWEFFASAVASSRTRDAVMENVARWVNETVTDRPLTDLYDTEGQGDFSPIRFMARPVAGGHFALLALERACGGKALDGLAFIEGDWEEDSDIDVAAALAADLDGVATWNVGTEL